MLINQLVSQSVSQLVNKYSNAYHKTIKMNPVDVSSSKHNGLNKEINKEDPKFEFGDHERISKYKKRFCKSVLSQLV